MTGPGHNNGPSLEGGTAWRTHCWTKARADLLSHLLAARNLPRDGVLLIGNAALERDWSEAGRLGGYLAADRYFSASA